MSTEFALPPLGEGVDKGTIVKLLVRPGDAVEEGQPLLEIEADKATVELPSPQSGTVEEVHVAEGDEVEVGAPLVSFGGDGADAKDDAKPKAKAEPKPKSKAKTKTKAKPKPEEAATPSKGQDDEEREAGEGDREGGSVEFELPALGEGVDKGTVVKLLVGPGDAIEEGQAVLEIEADKATVELPAPQAGTIEAVHVAEGDSVGVGEALMRIATSGAPARAKGSKGAPAAKAQAAPAAKGAREGSQRTAAAAEASGGPSRPARAEAAAGQTRPSRTDVSGSHNGGGRPLPAGPAVRRLARLLGVDLQQISGSGERGRITPDDVHGYLKGLGGRNGGGPAAEPALPDFSAFGPVEERPLSQVRKRIAEAMSRSWSLIPHVTQHDLADVTDLEAGRRAFKQRHPKGPKVTMTVLVAKACAVALEEYADLNSSVHVGDGRQVFKQHVHLGIAVDTEYGLLVPVLRDVDKKSVLQLSDELNDLAKRTRDKAVKPDELRGATFTISNLGGIGGVGFTPIVNWPQVAILGVSQSREEYRPGPNGPQARLMMPLSLSYDHRIVDGAQAARFTRRVADLLSDPSALLFAI